ncbi:MAG: hypothetical protein U9R25_13540 [Chloroflexota bacterium]|nr:hypothetical protein [Chloroflexota bacterium]
MAIPRFRNPLKSIKALEVADRVLGLLLAALAMETIIRGAGESHLDNAAIGAYYCC